MKTSILLFALLLSTLALSGCASTSKKSYAPATQTAPVESSAVVAAQPVVVPVTEPVATEIPAARRKYVNK